MKRKIALTCLCTMACGVILAAAQATAAPAPWFQWRSKIDASLVCSQTSLGPGWDKVRGPYKDSHCEKPALVK